MLQLMRMSRILARPPLDSSSWGTWEQPHLMSRQLFGNAGSVVDVHVPDVPLPPRTAHGLSIRHDDDELSGAGYDVGVAVCVHGVACMHGNMQKGQHLRTGGAPILA